MENEKRYVVQKAYGSDMWTEMLAADEIVRDISMSDCTDTMIEAWESSMFGELVKLTLHGTWHDLDRPLYIKATRPDGSIAFDGYGVDH